LLGQGAPSRQVGGAFSPRRATGRQPLTRLSVGATITILRSSLTRPTAQAVGDPFSAQVVFSRVFCKIFGKLTGMMVGYFSILETACVNKFIN
jgi:hypothetical protein